MEPPPPPPGPRPRWAADVPPPPRTEGDSSEAEDRPPPPPVTEGKLTPKRSRDFFGTPSFLFWSMSMNRKWCVFSNIAFKATPEIPVGAIDSNGEIKFFHGTCLSSCYNILSEQVFRVGLWRNVGSKQHPTGIWGCSHPGHSLDRAPLVRSWSFGRESKISQWDVPVAMLLPFRQSEFRAVQPFASGHQRMVIPFDGGTQVSLGGLPIQVWIHYDLYSNFAALNRHWDSVANFSRVACRALPNKPRSLYRCGDSCPMTCGRTIQLDAAPEHGWTVGTKSRRWQCPQCSVQSTLCHPSFEDA